MNKLNDLKIDWESQSIEYKTKSTPVKDHRFKGNTLQIKFNEGLLFCTGGAFKDMGNMSIETKSRYIDIYRT